MKKLLGIVVLGLMLITPSWADNIRDFEIEGMSIGDSALNFFTKAEFDKAKKAKYPDDTYTTLEFGNIKSKNYDYVSLSYKTNDKNYITVAVSGGKYFDKIKDCYKMQDQIYKEFKEMFPNGEFFDARIVDLLGLDGKVGTSRQAYIKLSEGSYTAVQCYDFDDKSKTDNMRVNLYSEIYNYWLVNEAYK